MSTCYRTDPEMTVDDLVKVPSLRIMAIENGALKLSCDGKNVLWAYVTGGIVTGYTRYGENNVGPILNAICDERIIRVIDEHEEDFFIDPRDFGPDYDPGDEDLA